MITARIALDLGRNVAAVPGPIDSPRHVGTNRLLSEGAAFVGSVDDVMSIAELESAAQKAQEKTEPPPEKDDDAAAILTAVLGMSTALPLTFRVLFPRLTARFHKRVGELLTATESELALERDDARARSAGKWSGFTVSEMAAIVERTLTGMGAASSLAPLVMIVGHGSSSLNNPHESAHDCGACGGGRGGPNARAFAQIVLLLGGVLAAAGMALFTWRELATAQGNQ